MEDIAFPGDQKYCLVIKIPEGSDEVRVEGFDITKSPTGMFGFSGVKDDLRWQISRGQFELTNDRFGTYQIYFSELPDGTVLISNYISELIARGVQTTLNDEALAVFVRLGYFLGDATPFKNIINLPPNSTLVVSSDGLKVTTKKPYQSSTQQPPSFKQAQLLYGDLFQHEMETFLAQYSQYKIMLPISGGKDSRHILLALMEAGRPPDYAITCERFAPSMNEDVEVANQLCQFAGLKQTVLPQSDQLFQQEIDNFYLNSFCADENNWALPIANFWKNITEPKLLFDGIAGDVLSASLFTTPERVNLFEGEKFGDLARFIIKKDGHLTDYLSPELKRRWSDEIAEEQIESELLKYAGDGNGIGHFYLWNRCIREIAHLPRTYMGRYGIAATPFLFENVFDLLINLPSHYFYGKSFHMETMALRYPKYKDIPFATKKGSTNFSLATRLKFVSDVFGYLFSTKEVQSQVNMQYIAPRLVKGILSPTFGTHLHSLMVGPLYLATLKRLVQNCAHG